MYFYDVQAFSGIAYKSYTQTRIKDTHLKISCNLNDVILLDGVFTASLGWLEKLTIDSCYIQDGR